MQNSSDKYFKEEQTMKYNLYTIFDKTAQLHGQVMQFVNDEVAKRSLIPVLKNMEHPYAQMPSHYTLILIGEYDDETGYILPEIDEKNGDLISTNEIVIELSELLGEAAL